MVGIWRLDDSVGDLGTGDSSTGGGIVWGWAESEVRVAGGLKMDCIVAFESSRSRLTDSVMSRLPFGANEMPHGRGFGNVMFGLILP